MQIPNKQQDEAEEEPEGEHEDEAESEATEDARNGQFETPEEWCVTCVFSLVFGVVGMAYYRTEILFFAGIPSLVVFCLEITNFHVESDEH